MTKACRIPLSRFWTPTKRANVVQIGDRITKRKSRETIAQLLERAIRDYPNRNAELVVIGWR
jgi:hypothetical protein